MRAPQRSAFTVGTLVVALGLPAAAAAAPAPHATAHPAPSARPTPGPVTNTLPKAATMTGAGGAVASVDPVASQVGIDVLAKGGNAADAAVATAAALGVVEPYANGIGGGGFFVYYDARTKKVTTIDGRESAPSAMRIGSFLEPDGTPMNFDKAVNSGLSVGVPGTPATWAAALHDHGTRSFAQMLAPAQQIAERGFVIDQAFTDATADNAQRFARFPATAALYLPGGKPVQPGTVLKNPGMAKAYQLLRAQGPAAMYRGALGQAVVDTARSPKTAPGVTVPKGLIRTKDLAAYHVNRPAPTHSTYKGLDVYGMAAPSSGGIAVGEALNLIEAYEKKTGVSLGDVDDVQFLHRFAEASATAFADRNRWVGDVAGVPQKQLLSKDFAAERACGFDPAKAAPRPILFGQPDGQYGPCTPTPAAAKGSGNDGQATTHLVTADKWGNMASYTLTIEQFGGSAMVVPQYGFLLNNELTDFNFAPMTPGVPDPNLPAPGKRPRSSMSPTIILKNGRPYMAVGSPGGSTIITTTLQVILEYLDRGKTLVGAISAPRISSRNTGATAEPALMTSATGAALKAMGQPMTSVASIGRATAIRVEGRNRYVAAAEPTRGGGGSAMVVKPLRGATRR